MTIRPDDIVPRPDAARPQPTEPLVTPIYTASVWKCDSPEQARQLLEGTLDGYVYQRDGHPNADVLADKCRELHGAERAAITSSGMAAMSLALLSQLGQGDQVVASNQMYGRTLQLLTAEAARLGIGCTLVDTTNLDRVAKAFTTRTRLLVVETIANPCLRVADIAALADICARYNAQFLVDNTFATPVLCRPIELGADLVLESISKFMNGHSDVMLGLLCGREKLWQRVPQVLSAWGLASSPFDCYLSARGLATMHLRVDRACANAQKAAEMLAKHAAVEHVDYPGLPNHADHKLAARQFGGRYGTVVTFRLRGGLAAAESFIGAARRIPFCPSLGEVSTTLSHPESTSHRGLSPQERKALGIDGGTIRLSVGVESPEFVLSALEEALDWTKSR
jgi:cystathionine beta-lyase/cystathionine gamma-synthase